MRGCEWESEGVSGSVGGCKWEGMRGERGRV
jgi:hypothetical protein